MSIRSGSVASFASLGTVDSGTKVSDILLSVKDSPKNTAFLGTSSFFRAESSPHNRGNNIFQCAFKLTVHQFNSLTQTFALVNQTLSSPQFHGSIQIQHTINQAQMRKPLGKIAQMFFCHWIKHLSVKTKRTSIINDFLQPNLGFFASSEGG